MSLTVFYDMVASMAILLLFCLPLVFASYTFQLEDKNRHLYAFFLGMCTAALLLLLVSTVSPLALYNKADTLKSYMYHVFFIHTTIPLLVTALAVFLLSGFQFIAVPSGLFGLFTVKVYQQLFLTSAAPRIMPVVFYILLYVSALFIFDALLHFCAEVTFYDNAVCSLCFCVILVVLLVGHLGWGLWYFKNIGTVYTAALFAVPTVLGLALHIAVYRKVGAL